MMNRAPQRAVNRLARERGPHADLLPDMRSARDAQSQWLAIVNAKRAHRAKRSVDRPAQNVLLPAPYRANLPAVIDPTLQRRPEAMRLVTRRPLASIADYIAEHGKLPPIRRGMIDG